MSVTTPTLLRTRSQQVKNETTPGANTRGRIGNLHEDMNDTYESITNANSAAAAAAQSTANTAASDAAAAATIAGAAGIAAADAKTKADTALYENAAQDVLIENLQIKKADRFTKVAGANNMAFEFDKNKIIGSSEEFCSGDLHINIVGEVGTKVYVLHNDATPPTLDVTSSGTIISTGSYSSSVDNVLEFTIMEENFLAVVNYFN